MMRMVSRLDGDLTVYLGCGCDADTRDQKEQSLKRSHLENEEVDYGSRGNGEKKSGGKIVLNVR